MRHIKAFEAHGTWPGRRVGDWRSFEAQSATRQLGRMELIEGEYPEISRAAGELGVSPYDVSVALLSGDLVVLDEGMWSRLENTDSYGVTGMEDFEALSGGYGKDHRRIASAKDPADLPPPLVVEHGPGRYYLVAGNTRLMWMRAIGHTPRVVLGRL